MAFDWIKMRSHLQDESQVLGISSRLKMNPLDVVGRLHAIWSWADEQTSDGFIAFARPEFIDKKAEKKGFAEAMQAVRWLTISDEGLLFPNFERHNGESAKKRAMDVQYKRDQRKRECASNGQKIVHEISTQQAGRTHVVGQENVRKMSGQQPDKTLTREEKRREENIIQETNTPAHGADVCVSGDPPARNRERKQRGHPFEESPAFDFTAFRAALPDWPEARCRHYHAAALEYSRASGRRYLDWVAAVRSWERKRIADGKPEPKPPVSTQRNAPDPERVRIAEAIGVSLAALPHDLNELTDEQRDRAGLAPRGAGEAVFSRLTKGLGVALEANHE